MKDARTSMNRMTPMSPATARACPPPLSPNKAAESGLLRWFSIGLTVVLVFGVLSPVLASLSFNVARIGAAIQVPTHASESPYGVCADLCGSDGICRHVVVPAGWHKGQAVRDEQIAEAASCH